MLKKMNSIETDVIICGAGISGLLMAKSLTNIGLKVACIEKYKKPKECNILTRDMKYMDRKYKLGKTKNRRTDIILSPKLDAIMDILKN